MTNREKIIKTGDINIDDILATKVPCKIHNLRTRKTSICYLEDISCNRCIELNYKWLEEEYKEPETDWNKVKVDTLIEVEANGAWLRRYFAKYEDGKVYVWCGGRTSKTASGETDCCGWDKARLVKE